MNWYKILKISELLPYGYWITNEGKIIPVDFEQHFNIVRKHGYFNDIDAEDKGWIKIRCSDSLLVFNRKLTEEDIRNIINIFNKTYHDTIVIWKNEKRYYVPKYDLKNFLRTGKLENKKEIFKLPIANEQSSGFGGKASTMTGNKELDVINWKSRTSD